MKVSEGYVTLLEIVSVLQKEYPKVLERVLYLVDLSDDGLKEAMEASDGTD